MNTIEISDLDGLEDHKLIQVSMGILMPIAMLSIYMAYQSFYCEP